MSYDSAGTLSRGGEAGLPISLSLKLRLAQAHKDAEERLQEIAEAQDILARNPDLERLLNILQKGRF